MQYGVGGGFRAGGEEWVPLIGLSDLFQQVVFPV